MSRVCNKTIVCLSQRKASSETFYPTNQNAKENFDAYPTNQNTICESSVFPANKNVSERINGHSTNPIVIDKLSFHRTNKNVTEKMTSNPTNQNTKQIMTRKSASTTNVHPSMENFAFRKHSTDCENSHRKMPNFDRNDSQFHFDGMDFEHFQPKSNQKFSKDNFPAKNPANNLGQAMALAVNKWDREERLRDQEMARKITALRQRKISAVLKVQNLQNSLEDIELNETSSSSISEASVQSRLRQIRELETEVSLADSELTNVIKERDAQTKSSKLLRECQFENLKLQYDQGNYLQKNHQYQNEPVYPHHQFLDYSAKSHTLATPSRIKLFKTKLEQKREPDSRPVKPSKPLTKLLAETKLRKTGSDPSLIKSEQNDRKIQNSPERNDRKMYGYSEQIDQKTFGYSERKDKKMHEFHSSSFDIPTNYSDNAWECTSPLSSTTRPKSGFAHNIREVFSSPDNSPKSGRRNPFKKFVNLKSKASNDSPKHRSKSETGSYSEYDEHLQMARGEPNVGTNFILHTNPTVSMCESQGSNPRSPMIFSDRRICIPVSVQNEFNCSLARYSMPDLNNSDKSEQFTFEPEDQDNEVFINHPQSKSHQKSPYKEKKKRSASGLSEYKSISPLAFIPPLENRNSAPEFFKLTSTSNNNYNNNKSIRTRLANGYATLQSTPSKIQSKITNSKLIPNIVNITRSKTFNLKSGTKTEEKSEPSPEKTPDFFDVTSKTLPNRGQKGAKLKQQRRKAQLRKRDRSLDDYYDHFDESLSRKSGEEVNFADGEDSVSSRKSSSNMSGGSDGVNHSGHFHINNSGQIRKNIRPIHRQRNLSENLDGKQSYFSSPNLSENANRSKFQKSRIPGFEEPGIPGFEKPVGNPNEISDNNSVNNSGVKNEIMDEIKAWEEFARKFYEKQQTMGQDC